VKFKLYIFMLLFAMFFSGCGPYLHTGLSEDKAKEYPLLMHANDDIVCANHIFKKGGNFSVNDASNGKYINSTNRFGEKSNFPDNTLFVSTSEGSGIGVVVYPNGKFVYEGGGLVSAVAINQGEDVGGNDKVILWQLDPEVICTYVGNKPFTPRRNN